MKSFSVITSSIVILGLSACSQMPKECAESWKKIESLSKQMGMPEDQIKAHF